MILWHSMTRPILAYFFERFNGLQIQLICDVWSSRKHETWLLHAGNGHSMDTDRYNCNGNTALIRYDSTIFKSSSAVQESLSLSESAKRLQRRRYRKRLLRRTRGNQARERTTRRAANFHLPALPSVEGSAGVQSEGWWQFFFHTFLSLMQLSCFKLFPDPCWVELALLRCWTNRMEALELHIVLACLGTVITIQL